LRRRRDLHIAIDSYATVTEWELMALHVPAWQDGRPWNRDIAEPHAAVVHLVEGR